VVHSLLLGAGAGAAANSGRALMAVRTAQGNNTGQV